ncbi:DUF5000 domain-containing lipoprotein [Sunxiuqinia elliptica]|uniref:DUF5000 domain-containing protein n=1 Tax=Sunxiuqinia elliptica TaxID=655355 RepID=A0A1I2KZR2_9BACT|nr:DUF5000 domain-containing lipoprotein [Sunxiuqinia elliptica]SFF70376.1 protein of unknown function [Sunxiuqinia elliptica]
MKKVFLYWSIIFCSGIVLLSACNDDKLDESIPVNPVLTPFKAVTAEDGPQIVSAEISDKNRTITLELFNLKSLKEVKVNLSVSKRAKLLAPVDTILTLDLTEPYEIAVNNIYDDLIYTVTATIPEFITVDKSQFKANNLDNDSPRGGDPMSVLWDGGYMSKPEDYVSIGYRNYWTTSSFTFDIGTRFDGSYYDLKQVKVHLYWAYTHTCPKEYELWGYMLPGEPPASGDWADWTKLADIDNSSSTLADFAEGDNVHFEKDDSPSVRYLRIINRKNWRTSPPLTNISICELSLWAWNK